MSDPSKPSTETPLPKPVISTTIPTIIYTLYLASLLFPITGLIGIIMAYVNKGTDSTILESHYQFQIRTFWIGLLYAVIGALLTVAVIGWLVLFFYVIWIIIRCVKGIKRLNQQQAIANPTSWMFG